MIYCDINSTVEARGKGYIFIAMPSLRVNLPTEARSIDYSTNGAIIIREQFSQDGRRCRSSTKTFRSAPRRITSAFYSLPVCAPEMR